MLLSRSILLCVCLGLFWVSAVESGGRTPPPPLTSSQLLNGKKTAKYLDSLIRTGTLHLLDRLRSTNLKELGNVQFNIVPFTPTDASSQDQAVRNTATYALADPVPMAEKGTKNPARGSFSFHWYKYLSSLIVTNDMTESPELLKAQNETLMARQRSIEVYDQRYEGGSSNAVKILSISNDSRIDQAFANDKPILNALQKYRLAGGKLMAFASGTTGGLDAESIVQLRQDAQKTPLGDYQSWTGYNMPIGADDKGNIRYKPAWTLNNMDKVLESWGKKGADAPPEATFDYAMMKSNTMISDKVDFDTIKIPMVAGGGKGVGDSKMTLSAQSTSVSISFKGFQVVPVETGDWFPNASPQELKQLLFPATPATGTTLDDKVTNFHRNLFDAYFVKPNGPCRRIHSHVAIAYGPTIHVKLSAQDQEKIQQFNTAGAGLTAGVEVGGFKGTSSASMKSTGAENELIIQLPENQVYVVAKGYRNLT